MKLSRRNRHLRRPRPAASHSWPQKCSLFCQQFFFRRAVAVTVTVAVLGARHCFGGWPTYFPGILSEEKYSY